MQALASTCSSGKHALLHIWLDGTNVLLPGTMGVTFSKIDGSCLTPQKTLG